MMTTDDGDGDGTKKTSWAKFKWIGCVWMWNEMNFSVWLDSFSLSPHFSLTLFFPKRLAFKEPYSVVFSVGFVEYCTVSHTLTHKESAQTKWNPNEEVLKTFSHIVICLSYSWIYILYQVSTICFIWDAFHSLFVPVFSNHTLVERAYFVWSFTLPFVLAVFSIFFLFDFPLAHYSFQLYYIPEHVCSCDNQLECVLCVCVCLYSSNEAWKHWIGDLSKRQNLHSIESSQRTYPKCTQTTHTRTE